jgi:phosphoglucomutase
MEQRMQTEYQRWLELANADPDLANELGGMDESTVEDAFYRDLSFGTGGLRGIIGAGTNRMNVYTVAKASQGLADYVVARFALADRAIAIAYDCRIKSDLFAQVAAGVFAANGIRVWIYPELMPTPCLSFAVRQLSCAAGVVITASHNPAAYNGYKVYGADGCQITTVAAEQIQQEIAKLDIFSDVKQIPFADGLMSGQITYVDETVADAFIEAVVHQTVSGTESLDKGIGIVYTPLNGTGRVPVQRTLHKAGYTNVTVVAEQEMPDCGFATCPSPNPEDPRALALGIRYARRSGAELVLGTDPDCDRVGIAVKNAAGEYVLLSGNEVGLLLLDFICARRIANGTMPDDPVMIKTIVTTDLAEKIASFYGVRTVNVLTGFKFIGEQIGLLEAEQKEDSFIFGFEESYGYLTGGYVRDKDGVDGVFMICEMTAWYAARGIRLTDRLQDLYKQYGFCRNTLRSYTFEGVSGFSFMRAIMSGLRKDFPEFAGKQPKNVIDYAHGLNGLPPSDVLKLEWDNAAVVIRPSGTEPKIKVYVSVTAVDSVAAQAMEERLVAGLETHLCA